LNILKTYGPKPWHQLLSPYPHGKKAGAYFASGWAFLIPYLAAYLIYAWFRWPVNVVADGAPGMGAWIPCLLHVYWFLHVVHMLLGGNALISWWMYGRAPASGGSSDKGVTSVSQSLAFWLCLALLFYIPGVYLEFPADPWEHYSRHNQWADYQDIASNPIWTRSSYYFGYSFIGWIARPLPQLKSFEVYYTGCCLLLCWQYYRLARCVGLGKKASLCFVLLQAITLGNNLFGFYRYYGMSSSLFAQLGAVALTRITLEGAKALPESPRRFSGQGSASPDGSSHIPQLHICHRLLAGMLLVVFGAFNHVQSLGVAGLGVAAVIVWRLCEWKRSMLGWLILIAIGLSIAAVLWYPRNPVLDEAYRPQGWLTAWYGFDFFRASSPSFDRAAVILGGFGFINVVAGLLLLHRNHVAGWLVVLPCVALCLPFVAIPFSNALATATLSDGGQLIAFHRIFFSIPAGLAFIALWQRIFPSTPDISPSFATKPAPFRSDMRWPAWATGWTSPRKGLIPIGLLLATLFAILILPPGQGSYNRLYNVLMVPPGDLGMRHVIQSASVLSRPKYPRRAESDHEIERRFEERSGILTTRAVGFALNATGATSLSGAHRRINWPSPAPPSHWISATRIALQNVGPSHVRTSPFWPVENLYTAFSTTGLLSGQWLPNEVAIEHAGQPELLSPLHPTAPARRPPQIWLEWFDPRSHHMNSAPGNGVDALPDIPEDRGRVDSGTRPRTGDRLVLQPVMRTLDGNGWRISLEVRGPETSFAVKFVGQPNPLGGDTWVAGQHPLILRNPGQYTVEIAATTLWPVQFFMIRYHFLVPAS
jgi:hypothetical protein